MLKAVLDTSILVSAFLKHSGESEADYIVSKDKHLKDSKE
jgi:predicted nucleic acid-binding protein